MGTVASPPTARALDVLELLARPGEWRFIDIVRELDLTQATAHAILGTLGDRGWIRRDPVGRTFTLGPAAAAFARQVDDTETLLQHARAAALVLIEETGYAASVVERVADSLVIASFDVGTSGNGSSVLGAVFPFAAPFGGGFAAWESATGREEWIARSVTDDPVLAARLVKSMDRSLARGYDLDWSSPALARVAQLASPLRSAEQSPAINRVIADLLAEIAAAHVSDDIGETDARSVTTIAAPVFDGHGRVVLNLCVHPARSLSSRQIETLGRRVARAASSIKESSRS